MKNILKVIAVALILSIMTSGFSLKAFAEDDLTEFDELKIVIDGDAEDYEDVPLLINNRTMLPLRAVLTNLGVENDDEHIIWNGDEQSVTIIQDDTSIYLKIGSKTAYLNGEAVELDVAPFVYEKLNRTYVPARFVSEALGKKVLWDGDTKSVVIADEENYAKIKAILDESDQAMENMVDFAMDLTYDVETTEEGVTEGSDIRMLIEQFGEDSHAIMSMTIDSEDPETIAAASFLMAFMNFESYEVDGVGYVKMAFTGDKWLKTEATEEEEAEEEAAEGLSIDAGVGDVDEAVVTSYSSDLTASSLILEETDTEYILKGDSYQIDMMEGGFNYVDGSGEIIFNDLYMEIIIDKETMYYKSITMLVDASFEGENGMENNVKINISLEFDRINEDYKIVVPDEVLDNIMEGDLFGSEEGSL